MPQLINVRPVSNDVRDQSVCAVVSSMTTPLERALAGQEVGPRSVVESADPLGAGLRRALRLGAEWVWLLDESAIPRPSALLALVEALDRIEGLPRPAILAGAVVGPSGEVDPSLAPWYRRAPTENAMTAAEWRLLPIRAAGGPVLVSRRAIETEQPPRPRLSTASAMLEWTARLLRSRRGYWVPESEHLAGAEARDPAAQPLASAALLLGGSFTGSERLGVGFELAERAGKALSQRRLS